MSNKKFDINKIILRIKQVKNFEIDRNVSDYLGITSSALTNYKRRDSIPFEIIFEKCEKDGINFHWLITGKGEMYLDSDIGMVASKMNDMIEEIGRQKTENIIENARHMAQSIDHRISRVEDRLKKLEDKVNEQ